MPPVTDEMLADRVETTLSIVPELPGRLDYIHVPGVLGRITAISHPVANLVTAARLDSGSAGRAIEEVNQLYASRGLAYGWVVGPRSTPSDLGERLKASGMMETEGLAGLGLTDLAVPIRSNPEIEIRQASRDELHGLAGMMGEAYGISEDIVRLLIDAYLLNTERVPSSFYLASVGGVPVSWAGMAFVPEDRIVVLGGAATLAQHRGKGIYSSLVARRLRDAAQAGMEAAVIQAVESTSAPICRKLGFREIGPMRFFVWMPSG